MITTKAVITVQIATDRTGTAMWRIMATVLRVPSLSERYIPDGDIIVATWWSTAYDVAGYGPKKGEKFYLVQHYETWGGPKDTVDASYKLGLKIITVSNWIKNIIENNLNGSVAAVISNAPNQNEFFPDRKTANQRVRILTPYRKEKWKGFEDAVQVFIKVKKQHPNVKLVTFGQYSGRDIPEDFEYHQGPIGEKLRHLYSSSDVFLFSSHSEGFGLPPMEAMACKCAVVTTNVGAIPDFSVPGETALVSPPGDIDTLAENLLTLIEDADKRTRFAEKGYEYIKQFTWGHSCDELETLFKTSLTTYEINLKGSSWNMH